MTTTPHTPAPIVLVPGFWLGAWAWDRVAEPLRAAGHQVTALTLPGLDSPTADRGGITLDDHVQAVVSALRAVPGGGAVLVGHSGGGPVVCGATDAVPDLVRRAVYVECGPLPDGTALDPQLDPAVGELPLPGWDELAAGGNSLDGLAEEDLAAFRERAVPHPAGPIREPLRLRDPRRRAVPVTLVSSSLGSAEVSRLAGEGHPFFAELTTFDVTYVDVPTGHWPMWSRPEELARALSTAAGG